MYVYICIYIRDQSFHSSHCIINSMLNKTSISTLIYLLLSFIMYF